MGANSSALRPQHNEYSNLKRVKSKRARRASGSVKVMQRLGATSGFIETILLQQASSEKTDHESSPPTKNAKSSKKKQELKRKVSKASRKFASGTSLSDEARELWHLASQQICAYVDEQGIVTVHDYYEDEEDWALRTFSTFGH